MKNLFNKYGKNKVISIMIIVALVIVAGSAYAINNANTTSKSEKAKTSVVAKKEEAKKKDTAKKDKQQKADTKKVEEKKAANEETSTPEVTEPTTPEPQAPVTPEATPAPTPSPTPTPTPDTPQVPACNSGIPAVGESTVNGIWYMKDYGNNHEACNSAVWQDMVDKGETGTVIPIFDECYNVMGYTKFLH